MKQSHIVLGVGALMCCIPALAFLLFGNVAQEPPHHAMQETVWPLIAKNSQFRVSLTPVHPPLHAQAEQLIVHVDSVAHTPLRGLPIVMVKMPMGDNTMQAPVTIAKTKHPTDFTLATTFSMAGDWEIDVLPTPNATPLVFSFQVPL